MNINPVSMHAVFVSSLVMLLAVTGCAATQDEPGRDARMPTLLSGAHSFLFYGDSLTDGSSYPDYVVNTLNREFPEARIATINAAVAGNTAADLRKRLEADVLALLPDLVLISIGTNDCIGNRPVEDYRADLEAMVSALLAKRVKVMLMLPSHLGTPELAERFKGHLEAMRAVAAAHGLVLADAHAEFLRGEAAGREMLGPDGVHHGEHGFEGMARAVLDALGLDGVAIDTEIRPWPGLLTEWETSAPVPPGGDYNPADAKGWQPYDAAAQMARQPWWNSPFPARGGWMPFDDRNTEQCAYGRTYYVAATAGKHELQVGGSPSPQIVWLNGVKVWQSERPHGYHPNADRVVVDMKKGTNEIVGVSNFMLFVGVKELPK